MSRDHHKTNEFERARDELFSHIHRCGVLKATEEQQGEWMDETVEYMAERFPELERESLGELRMIGMRFCRPVIARAPEVEAEEQTEETAETAGAGAAAA